MKLRFLKGPQLCFSGTVTNSRESERALFYEEKPLRSRESLRGKRVSTFQSAILATVHPSSLRPQLARMHFPRNFKRSTKCFAKLNEQGPRHGQPGRAERNHTNRRAHHLVTLRRSLDAGTRFTMQLNLVADIVNKFQTILL